MARPGFGNFSNISYRGVPMNKKKKDILIVAGAVALGIIPWIFYDITGDVSHALYGLAIDTSLFTLALMDCIIDLKKTIKEIVKNDNENNA